jgi:hypothetical protein
MPYAACACCVLVLGIKIFMLISLPIHCSGVFLPGLKRIRPILATQRSHSAGWHRVCNIYHMQTELVVKWADCSVSPYVLWVFTSWIIRILVS